MRAAVLGLALAASASAGAAEVTYYQWRDKMGCTQYTADRPPRTAIAPVQRSMTYRDGTDGSVLRDVVRAMERNPVTLFVANDCPYCRDAAQLLGSRAIPFSRIRYDHDTIAPVDSTGCVKLSAADMPFPVLMVGKLKVNGYRADEWNAMLDGAGYPRAERLRPPPPDAKGEKNEKTDRSDKPATKTSTR